MPSNIKEWKRTIEIVEKYNGADSDVLSHAEHDEVWLDLDSEIVTEKDIKELEELGWNDYGNGLQAFV